MRTVLLLTVFAVSTAAFAGKYQPVYTGEVSYPMGTASSAVEKAVKKALIQRGWRVREAKDGTILARLNLRGHQADIKVSWEGGTIQLVHESSNNLGYRVKKGEKFIHRNYNNWIMNLERDIQVFLQDV